MKVFVTGASGFVGSAITKELIAHGHTVLGLARSDASAQKLTALGAQPHTGSLDDHASLTAGAKAADAVIHCAFIHDFRSPDHDMARNCAVDLAAFKALVEGIKGTNKVIVGTNGLLGSAPPGQTVTEQTEKNDHHPRKASENYIKQLGKEGVRAINVRLPPAVHGQGDPNFLAALLGGAKRNGFAIYVGEGATRWQTVHRNDAASLYRLAIEKDLPPGTFLQPFEPVPVVTKDIAELISKKTGVPTKSVTQEEAMKLYGFIGFALAGDNVANNEETIRLTGWKPKEITVLEDLEKNY